MSIETFGDGGTVITGPDIQTFALLSTYRALKLEVETGIKFSRRTNIAQNVRDILLHNGKRAPRKLTLLLKEYTDFMVELGLIKAKV